MMNRIFFAVIAVLTVSACGTRLDSRVDTVNGKQVELMTSGSGAETVVFESGLGNDWTAWDEVAAEVARNAKVFAYSRPGYGKSGPAETPRDAATIVEELRATLAAEGLKPPYILVGHSFGGAYMDLFAKAHPEEVAALVLVDARHPDFTSECEAKGIDGCRIPASMVKMLPQVQQDEFNAFDQTSAQVHAAGGFGRYPVRVLTAGSHFESDEYEALWQSLNASLATEAADGKQTVFPGVGHNLEVEKAQDVARAILELIRERS